MLPYIVLRYLNKQLADMGGYTGHVEDVEIQLIRGAYQIIIFGFVKSTANLRSLLYSFPKPIFSIEWKSLFKGRLVSEVETYEPDINFAFTEDEATSQTSRS